MSKTVALRAVLTERLKTACPRVYYGQAAGEVVRPYVVYSVEKLSDTDSLEQMQMEVNVVDYGTDTSTCETIADSIETAFDRWSHLDEEIQLTTWNDRRQPVEEEDRKIIRRRLLIDINFYDRRK